MASSEIQPRQIRVRLWKKMCFALAMTLLFFGAVELVLYAVGVDTANALNDPLVGFSSRIPLMERTTNERGEEVLRTAQNKRRWFNAQSFPAKKPVGTKRIFCMGGSTTYGHPFSDSTSFAGWLRSGLPVVDPSQRWEVINAGGISYASYRVASLMEELVQYEPDVFIVYSVHNEFLERRTYANLFDKSQLQLQSQAWLSGTRTWSLANQWIGRRTHGTAVSSAAESTQQEILSAEVDEMLNHTIGPVDYHRDDEWRANVMKHYVLNLRRMVAIAKRAGARILFVSPTENEKNCSPFKSEFDPKLSEFDFQRLAEIRKNATQDSNAYVPDQALEYLNAALQIDPTYAEFHYRAGQNQLALQQYEEAFDSFRKAIHYDVCPLRAVDEVRDAIDRVVRDTRTPLVDFEAKLRALSRLEHGHTIFGEEYFLDHVHPTIDINRWLALWIMEEMQVQKWISGDPIQSPTAREKLMEVERQVHSSLDQQAHGVAYRNLAKVLHWAGKFEEALPRARDALDALGTDPESRYILADCLKNLRHYDESLSNFEALFSDGTDYPRAYEPLGQLLAELGRYEQAKAYLLLATLNHEKSASSLYLLGLVHLQLGEMDFALEALERAARIAPEDQAILFYLAISKHETGQFEDAIQVYRQLISAGSRSSDLHRNFAKVLIDHGQREEAALQLELALQLDPTWTEVQEEWLSVVKSISR